MSNKNEMDRLLSSKMEEYKVPYDHSDWEQMEEMLDRESDKVVLMRLPKTVLVAASIISILFLGGFGAFKFVNMASTVSSDLAFLPISAPKQPNLSLDLTLPPITKEETMTTSTSEQSNLAMIIPVDGRDEQWQPEFQDMTGQIRYGLDSEIEYIFDFEIIESKFRLVEIADPERFPTTNLTIGLNGGSEINHVTQSQLNYSVGFTAEYEINENWSLEAGINYGLKSYKERGSNLPLANSLIDVESTKARLSVLEIPLNLKWFLGNKRKLRPYISGGISTYFPIREEYTITYNQPINTSTSPVTYSESTVLYERSSTKGARIVNMNAASSFIQPQVDRHDLSPYFGIINIAAGIRYTPSQWINIDVAPFIHFPVSGIGLEERKLKTYGMNLTLSYNI